MNGPSKKKVPRRSPIGMAQFPVSSQHALLRGAGTDYSSISVPVAPG